MAKMQHKGGHGSGRMANLELLRCVAMMMVVVLHFLGKGELLPDLTAAGMDGTGRLAWLLESFCIVAVNVYMLISGYFLCASSFKISRLVKLYLQLWVYSAGIGILAAVTGILPAAECDTHYFLSLLFPVSMGHYWFMTAYLYLYLLLPLVGMAVKQMTKAQLRMTTGLLLLAFCLIKSVLPMRLEMDGMGYDFIWYLCVFLTAAYIRRFGIVFLEKKGRGAALYMAACLLIFGGTCVLQEVYLRTGSFGLILKVLLEYNHLLPLLASVGLFGMFLRLQVPERPARLVVYIAPYTLGVYLLHENLGVRYAWQSWLGAGEAVSVGSLIVRTLLAVICVFLAGILVDWIRAGVFALVHRIGGHLGWYRRLCGLLEHGDAVFAAKESS